MAHEIEENDGLVLHQQRAWHGLGTIVEDAPTPSEALQIAGMDWKVEQWPMVAVRPISGIGDEIDLKEVLNVRADTRHPLGIVGKGYTPIQNSELADFCESLAEQDDVVKIESAGSIRNGAKVWFLLKGESFTVRSEDEVCPYILVSNGHDGMTSMRCTPTTIRVVCSNTLHMVIPQDEGKGRLSDAGFRAWHSGDVAEKIEMAKAALGLYGKRLDENHQMIDQLAAKDMNKESIQQFFLECYTHDFGSIPETPTNKIEQNRRNKAMDACNLFTNRFDKERDLAGPTAWNALNAYTGWIQNDKKDHLKDADKARDSKIGSTLFGVNAERSLNALKMALSV